MEPQKKKDVGFLDPYRLVAPPIYQADNMCCIRIYACETDTEDLGEYGNSCLILGPSDIFFVVGILNLMVRNSNCKFYSSFSHL